MRARRFAIRILPDIGFLCSLAAQILAHPDRGDPQPDHPILPLLQRMVKAGDHDRHHAMLRVNDQEPSRVRNFQLCESLRPHFPAGTMDPIEAVQGDVNRAVIMRSFGETDLD